MAAAIIEADSALHFCARSRCHVVNTRASELILQVFGEINCNYLAGRYTVGNQRRQTMLLKRYKQRYNKNVQDLADEFNVKHRTMYHWITQGAEIKGKKGSRVITLEKELAREKG